MLVVVPLVLDEYLTSVCLVKDENVVAYLIAEGPDDPFAVRVHLRRLRCAGQDLHVLCLEDSVEGRRVLRVSIAKQKPELAEPSIDICSEVAGLLCRPVLGRMGGDTRDVQPPCAMFEEDQGVEAFAERGVDVEEVRRDDAAGLTGQELFPCGTGSAWSGTDTGRVQDLPYRRRSDLVAETGQLTLDPSMSPTRIVVG
ncbi:hypothetical protein [Actinocrispum sp. NPDC049592]|uniref:hypothetical protein n=1 Tax=Actinocrispum sp. NPDC049592 TaxID=3154835 RepID=UPI00342BC307